MERERKNYERKVDKIEDFIRRNIYGQKTRQAQSRRKMLARLKPPPGIRRTLGSPNWGMDVAQRSGTMVLEARELSHAWPGGGPLFESLDLTLSRGETLAIIGANGTGKTTLLEILAGRLSPTAGTVTWGKDVTSDLLPQRVERPAGSQSVLDFMYSRAPGLTLGEVRSYLGRFLFSGEDVEKELGMLSEGEFRRLLLAALVHSQANLLLLDEPTNHLDVYSREALEAALADFPGTLVVITHDRKLLSTLADRIVEFTGSDRSGAGLEKVVEYAGDYSYYRIEKEKLARRASKTTRPQPAARPERALAGDRERAEAGLSKNELRRLRERKHQLEEEISSLENSRSAWQLELADPETYRQDGRAAELSVEIAALDRKIETAYKEWEELLEYD